MQKGISFIDNSGIKEFHLSKKTSLEQEKKRCLCKKFIASYQQERFTFFPYNLVIVNDCLSDTLEKAKYDTNFSLQAIQG